MTISPRPPDRNTPHRLTRTTPPPATLARHWFVVDVNDSDGTYCAACGLPAANRRHVERAA